MDGCLLYISVFIITLLLTLLIESRLIPILSKRAKQPIYEEGPAWHMAKSGTPTMGGIAFVSTISLVLLFSVAISVMEGDRKGATEILTCLLFSLGNSLVGIFDDLTKLRRMENAGLSPLQKLGLQLILSIIFLMAREYFLSDGTTLQLPFVTVNLGIFYYPLAIFLLLGIINCANLTDGIDGLASSVAITIGTVFLLTQSHSSVIALISLALIGSTLGFLLYNTHPARIFMGDTGSLFLGALAVGLAFCAKNPVSIIPIGIVYVIEGVSVILQVSVFKLKKKRLFKMAPLHHHMERCGFDENRICIIAVIATLLSSCLAILFLRT